MRPFDAMRLRSGSAGDPAVVFSDVNLLMHGEGSNGGTTLTDSSSNAHTFGSISGVTTSTTQSRYGSASLLAASSGATAKIASHIAFALTAAWTMEFSCYFDSGLIWADGVTRYALARDNTKYFSFQRSGSTITISSSGLGNAGSIGSLAFDTWHDIAFVRTSAGDRMTYRNGTRTSSASDGSGYTAAPSTPLPFNLFNVDTGGFFLAAHGMYLDELRFTKAALHTGSSYALAGAAFPDS